MITFHKILSLVKIQQSTAYIYIPGIYGYIKTKMTAYQYQETKVQYTYVLSILVFFLCNYNEMLILSLCIDKQQPQIRATR